MSGGLRRFRAAIFDMDGLLLDSERPIRDAWLRLSAAAGTPLSEADYRLTVGRSRPDCLQLLAPRLGGLVAVEAMYEAVDAAVAAQLGSCGFALKPGALALLNTLRERGIARTVASSTRHAKVLQRLGDAGLLDHFETVHGGDQVARGKPHPDLFELAARTLGHAGRDCLVFEDSSYGAQGALAAGMGVVLVPDLKDPDPEIARHCMILSSLADSLPLLAHWFD